MNKAKWSYAFLILGLLVSVPAFASDDLESLIKRGDHRKLEQYYLEEAKQMKTKADQWEFAAEYYEKFPHEYSGDAGNVEKHIANARAIADDYRKAMHEARDMASRHRSLIRKEQ